MRAFCLVTSLFALTACATSPQAPLLAIGAPPQASDPYYQAAAAHIAAAPALEARARNVILFVGDGMGVSTITAARIYAGQSRGVDGESYTLAMDTFPRTAMSRTYGSDSQISDSAPTATAMTAGVKTSGGVIGLTAEAPARRCARSDAYATRSLFSIAEAQGLATGVVTTTTITHATPAATYANVAGRDWENDVRAARDGAQACADIARQLIEWPAGDGFEIALGGGRANFLPNIAADPENAEMRGARADGRNLIAEWTSREDRAFVWNRDQLAAADPDARVLGLFNPGHMAFDLERKSTRTGEPSLSEMTAAAITRLQREPTGYVLMVEGGRIDHGHHAGMAHLALADTDAFDQAIATALAMTNRDDTLIIVTADHSHVFTMAGYAARGNPILGLSAGPDGVALADDGLPYTTLGYANGPGSVFADGATPSARPNLTGVDTHAPTYRAQSLVPLGSESHAGEDVVIYAWGPGDDVVAGTLEQNMIFHIMARALGFDLR